MNELTPRRWLPCGLLFFVLHKLFFFHKVLSPTLESNPVIRLIGLEKIFEELYMFEAEFLWLWFGWFFGLRFRSGWLLGFGFFLLVDWGLGIFRLLDEFDPVSHGTGQEVENEFGSGDHRVFIDLERKYLVQVIRVKLLVLILVPYPYFGVAAFHVPLLLLLFGLFLLLVWFYELWEACSEWEFVHLYSLSYFFCNNVGFISLIDNYVN